MAPAVVEPIGGSGQSLWGGIHRRASHSAAILRRGSGRDDLLAQCDSLRQSAYATGSAAAPPCGYRAFRREKEVREFKSARCSRIYGFPRDVWVTALQKQTFMRGLWPAQHLLGRSGVLRGRSAVVQMPTMSETRAAELIIRSAFLADRTFLRLSSFGCALCHEVEQLCRALRASP